MHHHKIEYIHVVSSSFLYTAGLILPPVLVVLFVTMPLQPLAGPIPWL